MKNQYRIRVTREEARPFEGGVKPGDILVACDNEIAVPTGYLGHSALVVNDKYIMEAVVVYPYIRVVPINNFLKNHPKHAIFRPVQPSVGNKVVQWALQYYKMCKRNWAQGIIKPPFSFSPQIPLNDPWSSIYCSKLIWLSYGYGAGIKIKNDHFLFSPEDLHTVLKNHPQFRMLYEHPNFVFHLDS